MDHDPVLLEETLAALEVQPTGTYVDATFGAGGHAKAILARLNGGRLVALDADPAAASRSDLPTHPNFQLVHANFAELASVLDALDIAAIDGILFDLGVSSMQLDNPARGFSFRENAPLDMRLDTTRETSALTYLQDVEEHALADTIFNFGEERAARRIAHAIVSRREAGALPSTTGELARLVAGVLHRPGRRERIHPATKTFQALRIAVNDELGALSRGLDAALERVREGGRISVISFHSLEDRIVKRTFRDDPRAEPVTRKPVTASEEEQERNPRSRSAKMRAATRVEA